MSSVLILHAGALGDCILTSRLAIALQQRGDATVTLAARSFEAARWLTLVDIVERAADLELLPYHQLFGEDGPLDNSLVAFLKQFDLFINMIDRAGGAVERRLREFGKTQVMTIDPAPQPGDDRHVSDQWIHQLHDRLPNLAAPPIQSIGQDLPRPVGGGIIIHPGSGGRDKCCPLPLLIDVANRLRTDGLKVSWMLGPVEVELFDPPTRRQMEAVAEVHCHSDLDMAARAIARSSAFIGNDAGMTHVAGVGGVPTFALFGPTVPRVWRPLGRCVHTFDFRRLSVDELIGAVTPYVS